MYWVSALDVTYMLGVTMNCSMGWIMDNNVFQNNYFTQSHSVIPMAEKKRVRLNKNEESLTKTIEITPGS